MPVDPKKRLPREEVQRNLLTVVQHFDAEDRDVRERQIRKCKRLKLYWDSIFQAWYSEVAHDWRIWDNSEASSDQAYYDKPVNTFRAYLETVIAALSVTTPAAKCYPADADSSLDTVTARAGDKISKLIDNHNNAPLIWLRALCTYYTEGTVFGYTYPHADRRYGTYETKRYEDVEEFKPVNVQTCPTCNSTEEIDETSDVFQPENQEAALCATCGGELQFGETQKAVVVNKLVGIDSTPKTRVHMEVYGGLYVKIANYAKTPQQTPYLIFSHEEHYASAMEEYEHLLEKENFRKNKGREAAGGARDDYAQWGRRSTLYMGEEPREVVTIRKCWLRPSAFNVLGDLDDIKKLKELYPRGVKVCLVNDEFGSAESESLDDYWTISVNPHEDYLNHDPAGIPLVSTQEITNDLISLILQTVEHGIGQTFADPGVLNFTAYKDSESVPGGVYEATPKTGKSLGDGFYQMKTATLSGEVMPFFEAVQSLGQLVSGALPSLFGGQLDGSNTASEYSMSQAQARQRIQNVYKLFTYWWKEVKGKAIPIFINNMKTDEVDVEKQPDGSFMNLFIRMSELQGRIGKVELEAADNLPLTWTQIRDTVLKMIEAQNPMFLEWASAPENIPVMRDTLGLTDFYIPGEDDRLKQYEEIQQLLASEPIADPTTGQFMPSIEIDVTYDKHPIQFEVVRYWATSEAGRTAKIENEPGYQNVLLHGQMHYLEMNKQMVLQQSAGEPKQSNNPEKPKGSKEISGESDVPVKQ
jgi:hypothetical protein